MKNILKIVNDYIDDSDFEKCECSIEKEIKELNKQIDYEYTRIKELNSPNDEIRKMIKKHNADIYERFIYGYRIKREYFYCFIQISIWTNLQFSNLI